MKEIVLSLLPTSKVLYLKNLYNKIFSEKKIRDYYLNTKINIASLKNVDEAWEKRIRIVRSSSDNDKIPRHKDAGTLNDNIMTMHNGLKVTGLSYYGSGNLKLLMQNKGVHEPQEEYVFQEVLKAIPANGTMIELGAYWGFYSLWFANEIKNAKCYLLEPFYSHLISAKINFELNNLNAYFFQYWSGIGNRVSKDCVKSISVDSFIKEKKIERVNILHSDIQGAEISMLNNAKKSLEKNLIDFIFISTHSNDIHQECKKILKQFDYKIIASANCSESFSEDGLIVAKNKNVDFKNKIKISKYKNNI